jgi:hypothetical protein
MIVFDGYSLSYEKAKNRVVINLPQTVFTPANTIEPVVDRKVDVEEKYLAVILFALIAIFRKENET